jgi:Mn-dependent DtxR family transcriptional regulator
MPHSKIAAIDINKIPESYQEYIVTIYRLSSKSKKVTNIDIAKKMGNAPSSVYNMLKKLAKQNLIDWEPKQKDILLTTKGRNVGKTLILGHLIVELFLREYLGIMDDDLTHNLACKLEHHIIGPIETGFRKQIGESAYQKLVHIVENDTDPEETIKKIKEVFPSPTHVITQFSSILIDALPDSKDLIEKSMEKFLKSL